MLLFHFLLFLVCILIKFYIKLLFKDINKTYIFFVENGSNVKTGSDKLKPY